MLFKFCVQLTLSTIPKGQIRRSDNRMQSRIFNTIYVDCGYPQFSTDNYTMKYRTTAELLFVTIGANRY